MPRSLSLFRVLSPQPSCTPVLFTSAEKTTKCCQIRANSYHVKAHRLMQALRDRATSKATNSSAPHANGDPATPHTSGASRQHDQVATLRRQLEVQLGKSRSLQAYLRHCRGQLSAERNRCQDLENRLADKESEIDIIRKRQLRVRLPVLPTSVSLSSALGEHLCAMQPAAAPQGPVST